VVDLPFFSLSLSLSLSVPPFPNPTPLTPLGVPPSSALSRPLLNCLPLIFTPVPLRYGPSAGQALRDICGAARVGRIKSREGRKGKKKRRGCGRVPAFAPVRVASDDNLATRKEADSFSVKVAKYRALVIW